MNKTTIAVLFALICAVYFVALGVDTMDVDSSQYAAMSREMKESGSYLQVYEQGKDYLDKPPFLFWASAISMKIFGENNFGFKFPSILFAIFAVLATFRFARLFYDRTVALIAAAVLATCQAVFLITNDVRTDTILMSWVIIAMWQLAEWYQSKKIKHFLFGAAAIGAGMVTKGPIALFVPIFAFGSHFVLKREWKQILQPVYLLGLVVIAVVLVPMSIGLYQQFDLHPEKTVNGLKNVSGLKFFYWTQSFGRITGENVWNNNAPFSFLFENLLWGMLPWTLFFVAGLVRELVMIVYNRFTVARNEEFLTTGGFVLSYCSLGISKYQLPHYIYVVLPFIAIITAKMMYSLFWENKLNWLRLTIVPIQWLVIMVLLAAPFLILLFAFPAASAWPWIVAAVSVIAAAALLFNKNINRKLIALSLSAIIGLNIFLSSWFYPSLLNYQAGNTAGRFVTEQNIPKDKFFLYKFSGNGTSLHFYSKRIVKSLNDLNNINSGMYLLTMEEGLRDLAERNIHFEVAQEGLDYHVTALTGKFLNKDTRDAQCKKYYVVKLL
ncbi:4-amino-4-deoxy-L-arabinose transferase-like glycosyltransferase [Lacibacter cauensis]|uniref:4-amino-4-deoxy-L-arabinose transferase-like glycosyltransferase n=1 Tax=Lacibacter cauensis TaxID=510947 RepID=A0A562SE48_9BACT|nr:glycosyltransferase family 39 protein [Lacibacter cauensis]TWI79492.1 4-amino-4-deoxy-L-arabinose transferase-like glycosyltransferase [Lacibacter cauensis]